MTQKSKTSKMTGMCTKKFREWEWLAIESILFYANQLISNLENETNLKIYIYIIDITKDAVAYDIHIHTISTRQDIELNSQIYSPV